MADVYRDDRVSHRWSPGASACCPVRVLWPAIRPRVPPGSSLFSSFNVRGSSRILRAVMRKMRIKDAGRYSSHGFRRGAARDLGEAGSSCEVAASAGL